MHKKSRWSRVVRVCGLPLLVVVFGVLWIPACRVTDLPLWGPAGPPAPGAYEVMEFRDLPYYQGPNADAARHRLDVYLPKGEKNFPVVMLVHGGAWVMGDNRCCGLYSSLGTFLAGQGIAAVLPNYRLSPAVKHPEHVKDIARALAWVRANIGDHGGRVDQIFLAGHSAGGHLVSLLATDQKYLNDVGLSAKDVKGVIAISGVYCIPSGKMELTVGGNTPIAFRIESVSPIRGENPRPASVAAGPGIPLALNIFWPAFGNDPKVRAEASPIAHVRPGLPPFLIVSAEQDLPTLPGMAVDFHAALLEKKCDARFLRVDNRNHNSILFRAITPEDPVAAAMLEFVREHSR